MSDVTGGSSSSNSSLTQRVQTAFNLHDQSDTLALLRRIHKSPITPEEKNELRDAVFTFCNTSDAVVTPDLIDVFAHYNLTLTGDAVAPIVNEPLTKKVDVPTQFRNARPNPRFGSKQITSTQQEQKMPVAPSVEDVQKVPPVATDTLIPDPVSEQVQPEVPADLPVAADTAPAVDVSERIKAIKKEVNHMVGNPVNLIDSHNDIGREYMNALLDAMKKNNGGAKGELQQAMVRLEESFVAVKTAVGSQGVQVQNEEVKKSDVQEPLQQATEEKETIEPPEVIVEKVDIPEVSQEKEPSVSGFTSVHASHVEDKTQDAVADTKAPSPIPRASVPPAAPSQTGTDSSADSTPGMVSVAKEKQLQDLQLHKKQDAAVTDQQRKETEIAAMDPLMTPEVSNGLQQLLSEWSLFKSSGIFGTGPSGVEHVLYKKLAGLTMSAVMAGRFEGATPQIKRSITDYMNGWRYEEGILHEHGEMFEHYLRRVIKHIIDKRKK